MGVLMVHSYGLLPTGRLGTCHAHELHNSAYSCLSGRNPEDGGSCSLPFVISAPMGALRLWKLNRPNHRENV